MPRFCVGWPAGVETDSATGAPALPNPSLRLTPALIINDLLVASSTTLHPTRVTPCQQFRNTSNQHYPVWVVTVMIGRYTWWRDCQNNHPVDPSGWCWQRLSFRLGLRYSQQREPKPGHATSPQRKRFHSRRVADGPTTPVAASTEGGSSSATAEWPRRLQPVWGGAEGLLDYVVNVLIFLT